MVLVQDGGAMKQKAVRCYLYTRVSTDKQVEGYSLDAQQERLLKEAQHREMQVVQIFSDEGKSGKNVQQRPAFMEMMHRIEDNNIDNVDFVLVYKLSRFGRNAADVLNSLQLMQDYGVNLICVDDGIDSSKEAGKLMISVLSAVAEIERENIRTQTLLGRIQKASEGRWNGGFAPYGYKLEGGKLYIEEEEAEVIRIIFDEYTNTTHGTAYIAKNLNNSGYKKKIRQNGSVDRFSSNFVRNVISNPVYAGKISFGRRRTERVEGKRNEYHIVKQKDYMIYEGEHEAIVPEEMWLKANDKLNSNGKQHQFKKLYSLEHQHVLSGILKCPICGSGMYGTVNRKKKKDGSYYKDAFYYVCKHRKLVDGHHCTYNRQPSQKSIDDEVYAILADAVHNPRFAEFVSQTINKKTDDGALKEKLRELKKSRKQFVLKKEKLERQIDNLDVLDEYYDEKYDDLTRRHDRFYREIADVDSQIIETEAEIDAAYSAELTMKNALQEISGIKDRWYDFTDADRKNICNHFIDSVEIFPEKLENGRRVKAIHFAMPMLINDKETTDWWYSEAHRETVCLLTHS